LGFVSFAGLQGDGVADLGASIVPNFILAELTTIGPNVQLIGNNNPKRLMHAGWYALGAPSGVAGENMVNFWRYLEHVHESRGVQLTGNCDRLIYHVEVGCVMHIAVAWP
jgi:hypothetical protein